MSIWFWILVYVLLMPTFYLGLKIFYLEMSILGKWTIKNRTIAIILCSIPPIIVIIILTAVIITFIFGLTWLSNTIEDLFKGRNFWNKSAKW